MRNKQYLMVSTMLCMAAYLPLQAQTVTNVVAEQVGKTIEISYTLDKATGVSAEFSTDGKNYTELKSVSGAVGRNVAAGRNKIVWNPLLDYDKMVYDNVWFRVVGVSPVTDCQGHTYPVVKIGSQYWMAENLQCTKYDTQSERAGETLQEPTRVFTLTPYYTDASDKSNWSSDSQTTGVNLSDAQVAKLGYLYNWAAAMGYTESQAKSQTGRYIGRRQGICPNGWHLPSRADWNTLANALGGVPKRDSDVTIDYPNVGAKLKSRSGWYSGGNGTDDYGFSGLPAGDAYGSSSVDDVGKRGHFWSSDARSSELAYTHYLYYDNSLLDERYNNEGIAKSVRCLRD